MKRRRKNPPGVKVAKPSGRGKRFDVRIPGVNISISLQPTRKGITIVKPRVSRVTITRGAGENPGYTKAKSYGLVCTHRACQFVRQGLGKTEASREATSHMQMMGSGHGVSIVRQNLRRNPIQISSTPGRLGWLRPGTTTSRGFVG